MAITALHSAATGLRALSTRIDVVANNLANAETTAFKRSRVNFEDLIYLTLKQPGTTNAAGDVSPAGIFVGLGTRISNTPARPRAGEPGEHQPPARRRHPGQRLLQGEDPRLDRRRRSATRATATSSSTTTASWSLGMGDGYKLDPADHDPHRRRPTSRSARTGTSDVHQARADEQVATSGSSSSTSSSTRRACTCWAAASTSRPRPPAADRQQRPARTGRGRRSRVPRSEQRRSGEGTGHADQDAAGVRAEQPVDPDRRPGAADDRQPAPRVSDWRTESPAPPRVA